MYHCTSIYRPICLHDTYKRRVINTSPEPKDFRSMHHYRQHLHWFLVTLNNATPTFSFELWNFLIIIIIRLIYPKMKRKWFLHYICHACRKMKLPVVYDVKIQREIQLCGWEIQTMEHNLCFCGRAQFIFEKTICQKARSAHKKWSPDDLAVIPQPQASQYILINR